MGFTLVNDVTTALASSLASSSATSCTVTTGDGALFASASTANPIRCGFFDASTGVLKELVDVTGRSTDTLTISRAVEDATRFAAGTWTTGTVLAAVQTAKTLGAITPRPTYSGGRFNTVAGWVSNNANSTSPLSLNRAYYMPMPVSAGTVFTGLGFNLVNGIASSVARLAIYADAATGGPGGRLLDVTAGSPIDCSTSGDKLASFTWTSPYTGLIYLTAVWQGGTGVPQMFNIVGGQSPWMPQRSSGGATYREFSSMSFYQDSVTGTLPATATPAGQDSNCPILSLVS